MEQRLAGDPALRQRVEEIRLLRQEIREHAGYHAAPEALRRRVAALRSALRCAPERRAERRADADRRIEGWANDRMGRWLQWRPLAVGAGRGRRGRARAAARRAAAFRATRRSPPRLVASHVRSTLGPAPRRRRLVGPSHGEALPLVEARLLSAGRRAPLQGSTLLGGRVDYHDGRRSPHWLPAGTARRRRLRLARRRLRPRAGLRRGARYRTAHWTQAG
jgi:hypothetical protein